MNVLDGYESRLNSIQRFITRQPPGRVMMLVAFVWVFYWNYTHANQVGQLCEQVYEIQACTEFDKRKACNVVKDICSDRRVSTVEEDTQLDIL